MELLDQVVARIEVPPDTTSFIQLIAQVLERLEEALSSPLLLEPDSLLLLVPDLVHHHRLQRVAE